MPGSIPEKLDAGTPEALEVELVAGDVEYQAIDPVEEAKLVRKLDRVIMPLMAFVFFFQCTFCPARSVSQDEDTNIDLQTLTSRVSTLRPSLACVRISNSRAINSLGRSLCSTLVNSAPSTLRRTS
jgi:hypothetical protein